MKISNKERLWRLGELKFLLDNYDEFFKEEKIEFDMGTWFQGALRHGCGTSACALGAACLYPPFKKKGLHLSYGGCWPKYAGAEQNGGFDVGAAFFGLEFWESTLLLDPENYRLVDVKPHHVSRRVEKLIRKYSKKVSV